MAEQTPTPTPDPTKPDPVKPADPATKPTSGTEPEKKPEGEGFDPTKISDEDFEKIYTDNRLFRHHRFKSLSERAKKADELEKAHSDAEAKRLEEEGKWKELAEKSKADAESANQRVKDLVLKNSIQAEASKLGIVDVEAAALLLDKTNVKINDDGTAEGVKESLEALLEAKPYLKGGAPATPVGSPSNPNPSQTEAGTKKYKLSQLQDHTFFKENEKDIAEAMKLGLIEDDVYGTGVHQAPTPQAT